MSARFPTAERRTASPLLAAIVLVTACAPAEPVVPEPAVVIGFAPDEDYKLSSYGPIAAYFEALAAASDRVVLQQIGESTRGEPLYVAAISTPENLANMERYKEITRTLAYAWDPDPGRGTVLAEDEARALATEGKAIIWIDGGLHATEVAHGQLMPEMARYFAPDESPETQSIRENAILLLMANMNPRTSRQGAASRAPRDARRCSRHAPRARPRVTARAP